MANNIADELSTFMQQLKQRTKLHAVYPYNLSCYYSPLAKFFNFMLNNAGDPFVEPDFGLHSRYFEQQVLAFLAELYKIKQERFWRYVTSGSTEGNFYGIFLGIEVHPNEILYSSQDSHYSIAKATKLSRLEHLVTDSKFNGEKDYSHFEQLICANGDRPAIISLNIGTTFKGTIDNLDVVDILKTNKIQNYYIHCDTALSGMMLFFLQGAPKINFNRLIDSIAI